MPKDRVPVGFDVTVRFKYDDGSEEDKVFPALSEIAFAGSAKKDGKLAAMHMEVHAPAGGVMYLTELMRQQYVVKDMQRLLAQADAIKAMQEQPSLALPGDSDVAALAAKMARQHRKT